MSEVKKGDIIYFCGHQIYVMNIEGGTATVLFDGDEVMKMSVEKIQGFKDRSTGETMTNQELKLLAEKATPGPWGRYDDGREELGNVVHVIRNYKEHLVAYGHLSPADADLICAIRNELPALLAQIEERQWKPIETAPKDGTRILVWPYWSSGPGEAYWKPMKRTPGRWEATGGIYPGSGLMPTHWMPLPSPPEVQP